LRQKVSECNETVLDVAAPYGLAALLTGALAILLLAGCSTPVALADSRKPAAPITAPSLSGRLVKPAPLRRLQPPHSCSSVLTAVCPRSA
jgi:hypothetical protein